MQHITRVYTSTDRSLPSGTGNIYYLAGFFISHATDRKLQHIEMIEQLHRIDPGCMIMIPYQILQSELQASNCIVDRAQHPLLLDQTESWEKHAINLGINRGVIIVFFQPLITTRNDFGIIKRIKEAHTAKPDDPYLRMETLLTACCVDETYVKRPEITGAAMELNMMCKDMLQIHTSIECCCQIAYKLQQVRYTENSPKHRAALEESRIREEDIEDAIRDEQRLQSINRVLEYIARKLRRKTCK